MTAEDFSFNITSPKSTKDKTSDEVVLPDLSKNNNDGSISKSIFNIQDNLGQIIDDNVLPERYDGDKCMVCIENFPPKQANGNAMGATMCISNIIKYLWRLERKGNSLNNLDKVQWYLDRLRSYYND